MSEARDVRVAIIGAGASGIMAAIKLRETGVRDIVIFEKAASLGGTWRDNTYPGITCDVPSHAYRFSFAPNPDWSKVCSPGPEILAYIERTAAQFGVDSLIRYNADIVSATFAEGSWQLVTASGEAERFDIVITATGVLHHPVYPGIPGLEQFGGAAFHSARWDHGIDLAGKRVGIIGTGSTATQIVGAICDTVLELKLFQRTAQWVLPLANGPIPDEERAAYHADPDFLQAEYHRLTGRLNATFAAAIVGENDAAYAKIIELCESNLATVRDPGLRAKLTPDYKVGCKRLVMSGDFYEAVQRPNVELVTTPVDCFNAAGVALSDGTERPLDVIILATGFDTHRFFKPMTVTGPAGQALDDVWKARNQSYLTVAVPGFPNWFMIGGPASPIGNFSWLLTAETQFGYILQLIGRIRSGEAARIAPRKAAADAFNRAVDAQIPQTVWASGCSSWYTDSSGKIASWPWTFDKFERDLGQPEWADFEVVSAAPGA